MLLLSLPSLPPRTPASGVTIDAPCATTLLLVPPPLLPPLLLLLRAAHHSPA